MDYSVYLVTDSELIGKTELSHVVEEAILGGVSMVQLREKTVSTLEFYQKGLEIKKICAKHNTPLIINDRIDIALALDADGVHIGQNDMPLTKAREILGKNKIIGLSTPNLETAEKAQEEGADYLGVGAIFPCNTKKNADNVTINELKKITQKIKIPVVAIGGINTETILQLKNTGISGVAIVSAILTSNNPKKTSENFSKKIKKIKK